MASNLAQKVTEELHIAGSDVHRHFVERDNYWHLAFTSPLRNPVKRKFNPKGANYPFTTFESPVRREDRKHVDTELRHDAEKAELAIWWKQKKAALGLV